VRKKIFLFLGGDAATLRLSMKLPLSYGAALLAPFAKPTAYGLGKSGWITASFAARDHVPMDILKSWIDESYRAIAPKKLAATLPAGLA
jgi:predicted DNA-binding protein (MmcQ/YjbR family)